MFRMTVLVGIVTAWLIVVCIDYQAVGTWSNPGPGFFPLLVWVALAVSTVGALFSNKNK